MSKRRRPHPLVADINDRAFRAGVRPPEIMKRAGVDPSIWSRWAKGIVPTLGSIEKMNLALTSIIEEDEHGEEH